MGIQIIRINGKTCAYDTYTLRSRLDDAYTASDFLTNALNFLPKN